MSSSASEGLLFFALVINGGLAGAIYALIALAFVLVYKASRMINFALGEWIMFGSLLASTGSNAIGLDLGGAVLFGCVGMALLAVAFNAIVLGRLVTRPVISVIMGDARSWCIDARCRRTLLPWRSQCADPAGFDGPGVVFRHLCQG